MGGGTKGVAWCSGAPRCQSESHPPRGRVTSTARYGWLAVPAGQRTTPGGDTVWMVAVVAGLELLSRRSTNDHRISDLRFLKDTHTNRQTKLSYLNHPAPQPSHPSLAPPPAPARTRPHPPASPGSRFIQWISMDFNLFFTEYNGFQLILLIYKYFH